VKAEEEKKEKVKDISEGSRTVNGTTHSYTH
jgi:hypothetical protein